MLTTISYAPILQNSAISSWGHFSRSMQHLMSIEHLKDIYSRYAPELGEFKIERLPLSRCGEAHHPFVLGTDLLVFSEVRAQLNRKQKLSILELGCGHSHEFIPPEHLSLSEESQPPILARALKLFFKESVNIKLSDRFQSSRYLYVKDGKLLSVIEEPKCKHKKCQSLDSEFEGTFYGLSTMDSWESDYSVQSNFFPRKLDLIFARNQNGTELETYLKYITGNLIPLLNETGVVIFSFDPSTQAQPKYKSRDCNIIIKARNTPKGLRISIYYSNRNIIPIKQALEESRHRMASEPWVL